MSSKNQLPDLDKIFREEDDDGFLPSGGSRLASIFGMSTNKPPISINNQHQTLSSKQVINVASTQESKTEVIIAKAVHAFKLQNGQYTSIGKLGIALVGNVSTKSYQLILYRSKQEHISVVSITPEFSYTVQANNYSTYYDSRQENWSILFENNKECIEFAREIGLSRYLSRREKTNNSFFQDLNAPEKSTTAKEGDKLSVKYVINTEITHKINSTAELTMTVEISTDDNWERILLGSTKDLKRMLILPPSKQISLGPGFPKERDIFLEIEIINIQSEEEEVKIPESKSQILSSKAAILSRMAKMGQSILPKTSISTTTDSEDTEDEIKKDRTVRHRKGELTESSASKKHFQSAQDFTESANNFHKVARTKHVLPSSVSNSQQSLIPIVYTHQWSPTQIQPQYVTMDGQSFPIAQQSTAQTIPAALDPGMNIFLAEARTQNAEIRMGMSKISDNIQKLLDKFHILELQNASSPSNDRTMENTMKMILSMNASQLEIKNIANLSAAKETSSNLEEKNDNHLTVQLQETISAKNEELKTMRELINNTTHEVTKLKLEKRNLEEVNLELKEKITSLEKNLVTKKQELDNLNSIHETTKENANDYQQKNCRLEREILQLQSDCKALEIIPSTKQKNSNSKSEKNKEIKLIMNNTYHTLLAKFTEDRYSTSFIKETIASTLRDITLQVLNDEKSEEESSDQIDMNSKDELDEIETLSQVNDNEIVKDKPQSNTKIKSKIDSEFDNIPQPIPPMDSSNNTEWSVK